MIYQIMRYCRNFFLSGEIKNGAFTIVSGEIQNANIRHGRYILIQGSAFNDGVFRHGMDALIDEEFTGTISLLSPPPDFLELCNRISEWREKNQPSPFASESFGGVYSYTRATNNSGKFVSWADAFSNELKIYRKV